MRLENLISVHPQTRLAVIIDERLSASSGQLRALPLLLRLGWRKFSTIPDWGEPCHLLLPDSQYTKYYPSLREERIAIFTCEKLERTHRFSATLFLEKLSIGEINGCVFVVDTENFRVRRALRPLIHNANYYSFDELYRCYQSYCKGESLDFPLKDTYNVFLQELASKLQKILNKSITRSYELFVYDKRTINEIIWDWLIRISEKYEESPTMDFRKFTMYYLKPLIENDYSIQKIAALMENLYVNEFRLSSSYIKQERAALRVSLDGTSPVQPPC